MFLNEFAKKRERERERRGEGGGEGLPGRTCPE